MCSPTPSGLAAWYCAPGSRYGQVASPFYPDGAIWKYLCPSIPTAVGAVLGDGGANYPVYLYAGGVLGDAFTPDLKSAPFNCVRQPN